MTGTSGDALHAFAAELYPICRSITGEGVRDTLRRVGKAMPGVDFTMHEVPTGTPVFDWTVPQEWNIADAYVANAAGERVIDFRAHNLHVVSYSEPVSARMGKAALAEHVFTLPDRPNLVPYRTSYYDRSWGFCAAHDAWSALPEGDYDVCVDSTLADGSLTYGEAVVRGSGPHEVLLSAHVCHPSLANDNLSGIALATFLAAALAERADLRHTYRFVFVPGTIGSITWLARNEESVDRIVAGLVLSGVGDRGAFTYKRSRRGATPVDRAVEHVLRARGDFAVEDFSPYGYDERQYCSPGFDLPVGRLSRSPHGEYPEYHTSGDDLSFITPDALGEALDVLLAVVDVLEGDTRYVNLNPKCEPQLGRRGLYRAVGGAVDRRSAEMALLWVLNLSDGAHSLLDIAERAQLPFATVRDAATLLEAHDLLKEVPA